MLLKWRRNRIHFQRLQGYSFSKKVPAHALELDIQLSGLHVKHHFLKDAGPFGHGLSRTSLEFLKNNSWT